MAVAQELLKDNKDNLEKKSGSLSLDERKSLDSVKLKDDVVKNAQETKFQVKTKQGREIPVSARVLMEAIARGVALAEGTNYQQKLQSADIKLKVGNNVYSVDTKEFGRGSELMAFLQVAAGGNLVPDGKFGQATADAFSKFVSHAEKVENTQSASETVDMGNLFNKNFYDSFRKINPTQADILDKQYKVFKNDGVNDGYLTGTNYQGNITLRYTSKYKYETNPTTITFKSSEIQNAGKSIDAAKLLNVINGKITTKESDFKKRNDKEIADANAKTLEKSAEKSLDNLEVGKITTTVLKDYIKDNGWNLNGKIDFSGVVDGVNGVTIENGSINIEPKNKAFAKISLNLSLYKKADNTFDTDKFMRDLNKKMLPLAKNWGKEDIQAKHNTLTQEKPEISELSGLNQIATRMNKYTNQQKKVAEYTKEGVLLDSQIEKNLKKDIDRLNKQKNYLVVKNRFDKDLVKFEKAANATGKDRLSRQEEKTLSQSARFQYENLLKGGKVIALNLSPKVVYEQVGRQVELNAYLKRYEKVAIALD